MVFGGGCNSLYEKHQNVGLHKGLWLGVSYWHFSVWQLPTFFLYKNQITPTKVLGKPSQHNYHAIVSEYSTCLDTRINFFMNPIKSYPDPFAEIFDESQEERNLEKMFDVDLLGISPKEQSVIMIKGKLKNLNTPSNSKKTPVPLSSLGMRTK